MHVWVLHLFSYLVINSLLVQITIARQRIFPLFLKNN